MPGGPTTKTSAREATDYLRGATILLVMVTHFSVTYFSAFYQRYLFSFASMSVAIFFLVSGNGMAYSFEKRFSANKPFGKLLREFYLDRSLKVLVPYWLSLILVFPIYGLPLRSLFFLRQILLVPPSMLWFISSILECYLAAPFLYLLFKKLGPRRFLAVLMIAFAALWLFTRQVLILPGAFTNQYVSAFSYRSLLLGNLVFFAAGLLIPWLVSTLGPFIRNAFAPAGSLILFYLSMKYGRQGMVMYPAYLFSGAMLCASLIARRPWLPLKRGVGLLGRNSLTLYIYHRPYFLILTSLGLLYAGSVRGILIAIVLSPALIAFSVAMTWFMARSHLHVKRRTGFANSDRERLVVQAQESG